MRKQDFLHTLKKRLSGLPRADIEERLAFYGEMIDDRIEEGLSEEEAVADIGSVEDIVSQIISDTPLAKIAKERIKPKRTLRVWESVLLILGSPIWLSLCIAAFAVLLSVYVVIWSVLISVWAVFVSLAACGVGGIAAGTFLLFSGQGLSGFAMMGAGILCAGLAIFLFFGCKAATKGVALLTKKLTLGIKMCFINKEDR